MSNNLMQIDIAIIGGGIAGLMLQYRLNNLGYSTLLLEQHALGAGQTSKAQGIIHGGIKYALFGQITKSAIATAEQTKKWASYFSNSPIDADLTHNNNHINLSNTKILSTYHDLWNNGSVKNKLKQLLLQKTLSSHGQRLDPNNNNYPNLFHHSAFKGTIYRINETVVDVFSLINNLSQSNQNKIIKIDQDSLKINLNANANANKIDYINFSHNHNSYQLKAQKYIFTCGQDNDTLSKIFTDLPQTQLRPLHMVIAKFPEPHILYGHYIGDGILPELTITTHHCKDGQYIWYLGGKIAENGININQEAQIAQAKILIQHIFPWLSQEHWQWSSFFINRAEPLQTDNSKPDNACFAEHENALVAWPVKLALAPMLCDNIIKNLNTINFEHHYPQINIKDFNLTYPSIAKPIWEELFNN